MGHKPIKIIDQYLGTHIISMAKKLFLGVYKVILLRYNRWKSVRTFTVLLILVFNTYEI